MEKILSIIAFWLLVIGGLNWGLVGIFNWNLVSALLGEASFLTRLVYILVGVSAIWMIFDSFGRTMYLSSKK